MKILFLTIAWPTYSNHNIYTDLMDAFVRHGHSVTVVCSAEKRLNQDTTIKKENGISVLRIKTGNLTQTPYFEKGISNLKLGYQFKHAIKEYLSNCEFDLVIMSTPPVTLSGIYKWLKKEYKTKNYLLLKDIWPQAIVDEKAISKHGIIFKYFSWQEKRLYNNSDYIGCMSNANIKYLKSHNKLQQETIVENNPNSIKIRKNIISKNREYLLRYNLPLNKTIFIVGGNLGQPQGIKSFMDDVLNLKNKNAFFLFVGDGTESEYVSKFIIEHKLTNARYIKRMPKDDYENVCECLDVGLILLDEKYTIPNFPSRLLSYCENRLAILCYTDKCTDVGDVVTDAGCGYKIIRPDFQKFAEAVKMLTENSAIREEMGKRAFDLLRNNYDVEQSYETIVKHFKGRC